MGKDYHFHCRRVDGICPDSWDNSPWHCLYYFERRPILLQNSSTIFLPIRKKKIRVWKVERVFGHCGLRAVLSVCETRWVMGFFQCSIQIMIHFSCILHKRFSSVRRIRCHLAFGLFQCEDYISLFACGHKERDFPRGRLNNRMQRNIIFSRRNPLYPVFTVSTNIGTYLPLEI